MKILVYIKYNNNSSAFLYSKMLCDIIDTVMAQWQRLTVNSTDVSAILNLENYINFIIVPLCVS